MNCKQGDIAMVVTPCQFGLLVTCEIFIGQLHIPGVCKTKEDADIWQISRKISWTNLITGVDMDLCYCPDKYLIPLSGFEPGVRDTLVDKIDELERQKRKKQSPVVRGVVYDFIARKYVWRYR